MIEDIHCPPQRVISAQERLLLHTLVWQQHPSRQVVEQAQGPGLCVCPAVQEAVLEVLGCPVSQAAPPSTLYISRLVKQLIIAAEDQDQELSEQLLELNTALLLQGDAADATQQREASGWQYRTFYYSSSPSWQELQQLQTQHHGHLVAAAAQGSGRQGDANGSIEQQQAAPHGGWALPAELQQRMLQRQQVLQQLLSGVHLQQAVAGTSTPAQCSDGVNGQQPDSCSSCRASEAPAAHATAVQAPNSNGLQQNGCSSSSSSSSSAPPGRHCSGLITTHSSANMFEGGTGCHMWDAGFLMAEFVLNNRHLFAGKRVLEVGCGPGLVATCLCRSGCDRVLLTDGNPWTLVNCLSNLSMNGHSAGMLLGSWREATGFVPQGQEGAVDPGGGEHQVMACPLDWDEDVPGLCADVVVGSDICYDPDAVPSLVRLLAQLLRRPAAADAPQHSTGCRACAGGSARPQQQEGDAARAAAAAAGEPSDPQQPAGSSPSASCSGGWPVAYISTTKRQDSTLQLFLDLCAAAGLAVEEVPKDPAVWAKGWGSSSGGSGGGSSSGSSSCCACGAAENAAGGAIPEGAAVFQELPALQDGEGRERYVLHRVMKRVDV